MRRNTTIDTVQDSLGHRPLKVARQACPAATTVGAKLTTKPLGSEAKQLGEHTTPLIVDGAKRLEHHCREEVRLAQEARIVLSVLLKGGILLARIRQTNVVPVERAGDRNIDG